MEVAMSLGQKLVSLHFPAPFHNLNKKLKAWSWEVTQTNAKKSKEEIKTTY